jgi:hypothetical protein
MFTILPGAYLVTSLSSGKLGADFITDILFRAIIIGIGGWTGTILCSPTLLGTTRGLLWQSNNNKSELDADRHQFQEPLPYGDSVQSSSGARRRRGSVMSHTSSNEPRGRHHRHESNVSVFDFNHPTSTMLFF